MSLTEAASYLLQLDHREPGWFKLAACRGKQTDLWFPEPAQGQRGERFWEYPRSVCSACPVREDCLQYSIDNQEYFGMWGGKTPKERGITSKMSYSPPGVPTIKTCAHPHCVVSFETTFEHKIYCSPTCSKRGRWIRQHESRRASKNSA